MQTVSRSPAFIKKRNFLMMVPLLILPFIVILFYILGGGKMKFSAFRGEKQTGLNLQLPDAHFFKKKEPDKLGLYEASRKDSDIRRMALRNDPYRADSLKEAPLGVEKSGAIKNIFEKAAAKFPGEDMGTKKPLLGNERTSDAKEKELIEKLNQLKEQLNRPAEVETEYQTKVKGQSENQELMMAEQLRKMKGENEPDPEMSQLNKMLDKVMVIQHPGLVQDSISKNTAEQKPLAYEVSLTKDPGELQVFGAPAGGDSADFMMKNRFYEPVGDQQMERQPDNAIKAVIPENQTLVSGSTVKLQLENDIQINDHLVAKGQFIYGTCSLNNERLKIQFSSIRSGNSILPVSLKAYDLDGLAGIFIPGSMNRDVAKESGDQAINSFGLATFDPSIGAQAANAGIQTAKTLLSRKVKLVKVTVKAGYQVLLKDDRK